MSSGRSAAAYSAFQVDYSSGAALRNQRPGLG